MGDDNPINNETPKGHIWAWGLVESAVEGIATIDELGLIEYMNPAASKLFGYSLEEAIGKNIKMLMPNPYSREHDDYLRNYLKTGKQKVIGIGREVVGLRKDGSTFPMHLSVSEVEINGQRRFTGLIHDITNRRNAQAEKDRLLQELNWRNKELNCLYRIGELLRSNVLSEDVQEDIVQILDATLSRSNITGVRLSVDDITCASSDFQSTPWIASVDIVVEQRRRGSLEVATLQDPAEHIDDVDGMPEDNQSLLDAIGRLLGEALAHQEAEAKVLHASKLASIGEMAAGMGHEINNPVNGIINCADLLLGQPSADPKTIELAGLIRSEAERIARIVRDLLTFSRQDTALFSAAHFKDIVDSVITLSRKSLEKSHIQLTVDIDERVPKLECRSEQIQQVVMNLVINAIHALDEKYPEPHDNKKLTISAKALTQKGVPFLRMSIIDYGMGIAPAHLERIYDPFFTTKGRNAGTGLGLSVSDGIVKNHKGTISVESEHGEYTAFHVDLPLRLNRETG